MSMILKGIYDAKQYVRITMYIKLSSYVRNTNLHNRISPSLRQNVQYLVLRRCGAQWHVLSRLHVPMLMFIYLTFEIV